VDAEKKRAYVEPGALQGRKLIEPFLGFGTPHAEHIGAQPYAQWQKAFDPLLTPGARNYWKPHNFIELVEGALNSMIRVGIGLRFVVHDTVCRTRGHTLLGELLRNLKVELIV